jgi:hypothetical protein
MSATTSRRHDATSVRRIQRIVLATACLLAVAALWPLAGDATPGQVRRGGPSPAAEYVGNDNCAACHMEIADLHRVSGMGRALSMPGTSEILRSNARLTLRNGAYTYEIVRTESGSIYSVTDGVSTVSAPILYAVGQGKAGQTFIYKLDDDFYESRVSYYRDIKGLDWTIGHTAPEKGTPLREVLGRMAPGDEMRDCMGCHATGAVTGSTLRLDRLVPGVNCESCHGAGSEHIATVRAGSFEDLKISNPGRMSGDEISQEFCGKCHRSAEQVLFMPKLAGINNVRFQPYRIFNSKCYSDDRRISCVACHDPHAKLEEREEAYDANCLACHAERGKTPAPGVTEPPCPVGTKSCSTCHMPKTELPGAHIDFTDHRIRIVRKGEAFPP